MATKIATARASGDAQESAQALIKKLKQQLGDDTPALVMTFASTKQPLADLAPALSEAFPGATVLGASTAGEFTEEGDTKSGSVAIALCGDFAVRAGMGDNLKADLTGAVQRAIGDLPEVLDGYTHRTGLLLLDPLSGNGEEATLLVAGTLGSGVPLAGGAAGDDLGMAQTHVSCGSRAASDALVVGVIYSNQPLGVGVCHGHEPLSEPLTVTKASGGTVFEVGIGAQSRKAVRKFIKNKPLESRYEHNNHQTDQHHPKD
jgi:hypothetical protein